MSFARAGSSGSKSKPPTSQTKPLPIPPPARKTNTSKSSVRTKSSTSFAIDAALAIGSETVTHGDEVKGDLIHRWRSTILEAKELVVEEIIHDKSDLNSGSSLDRGSDVMFRAPQLLSLSSSSSSSNAPAARGATLDHCQTKSKLSLRLPPKLDPVIWKPTPPTHPDRQHNDVQRSSVPEAVRCGNEDLVDGWRGGFGRTESKLEETADGESDKSLEDYTGTPTSPSTAGDEVSRDMVDRWLANTRELDELVLEGDVNRLDESSEPHIDRPQPYPPDFGFDRYSSEPGNHRLSSSSFSSSKMLPSPRQRPPSRPFSKPPAASNHRPVKPKIPPRSQVPPAPSLKAPPPQGVKQKLGPAASNQKPLIPSGQRPSTSDSKTSKIVSTLAIRVPLERSPRIYIQPPSSTRYRGHESLNGVKTLPSKILSEGSNRVPGPNPITTSRRSPYPLPDGRVASKKPGAYPVKPARPSLTPRKTSPNSLASKPSCSQVDSGSITPNDFPSPPVQQLNGRGFFPHSQSFQISGGTFTDASHTTQIYSGVDGLDLLHERMAPNALHNSASRFDPPKCDPDTRVGVIEEIVNWIKDLDSPTRILCMTGPAGCGKSALEQTVAEMCAKEGILAASFFFFVTDSTRNSKARFIPTLVYQIAISIPETRPFIKSVIENDPSVFDKSLDYQAQTLFVNPLKQLQRQGGSKFTCYAILIDGLDECQGLAHQSHVLRILHSSIIETGLPLRFFLASRPEYSIRTALQGHLRDIAYVINLDDKYDPDADIRLYLQRRLVDIGLRSGVPQARNGTWPSESDIEKLVENASGQFIYAATIIKFVDQRHFSPVDRLGLVLSWTREKGKTRNPFAPLDSLYAAILTIAQDAIKFETDDTLSIVRLLCTIGSVQGLDSTNVSQYTDWLECFLCLSTDEIERTLVDLHSLVNLSEKRFKFHHKSFTDFLQDPSRSGSFYLDPAIILSDLTSICLKHMSNVSENHSRYSDIIFWGDPIGWSVCQWTTIVRDSALDDEILHSLESFDINHWIARGQAEFYDHRDILVENMIQLVQEMRRQHGSSMKWDSICNRFETSVEELTGMVAQSQCDREGSLVSRNKVHHMGGQCIISLD